MDAKMNYRVKHRGGEWELRYSSENTFWFWISRSRNTGGAFKGPYKSESSPMTCELELGLRDLLQMQWQSLQQWLPCLASTLPERKPYYCTLQLPTTVPSPTYKNKLQFGSPLCYLRCFRPMVHKKFDQPAFLASLAAAYLLLIAVLFTMLLSMQLLNDLTFKSRIALIYCKPL